jgi:hypothetical protein
VIGGFAVIAHGYVRATKDSDLLVPDGPSADAAVLRFLERVDGTRLRDDKVLTLADVGEVSSASSASPIVRTQTAVTYETSKRFTGRSQSSRSQVSTHSVPHGSLEAAGAKSNPQSVTRPTGS